MLNETCLVVKFNKGSIVKAIKLKKLQRPCVRDINTVEAYLSGRNVFVSVPTGAGKSSTFKLAGIYRTTIVSVCAFSTQNVCQK